MQVRNGRWKVLRVEGDYRLCRDPQGFMWVDHAITGVPGHWYATLGTAAEHAALYLVDGASLHMLWARHSPLTVLWGADLRPRSKENWLARA